VLNDLIIRAFLVRKDSELAGRCLRAAPAVIESELLGRVVEGCQIVACVLQLESQPRQSQTPPQNQRYPRHGCDGPQQPVE
jgi:hypothetical protein